MINRILGLLPDSSPDGLQPSKEESGPAELAQRQLDKLRTGMERYIGEYPGVTIGAAVALGVFIGWLVKRR
ncbi:hypothetical protein [Lignipirellula cremea]|uniref:DUF883 domain-containing protein n=1 Tax=Lignipirellula cremea TaxID=2528010 RepID=A0A518DU72_9BACT|nr:hypothetical protein [Lignipirellula cremea]QDU95390.1 hypothetical protein Pla8534_32050 [Lignipirellula cremea]